MSKVKAEVLCNNIYIDGEKHLKGDTVSIDSSLGDQVLKGDEEAGRDPRLKITKTRKPRTLKVEENGNDS